MWAVQEEVLIILFSHATITKRVKTIEIMPKFVFIKGAKFETTSNSLQVLFIRGEGKSLLLQLMESTNFLSSANSCF